MTLQQAVQEAIAVGPPDTGLIEPLFPKSAYLYIWRYDTEPTLTFYLATGDKFPDRTPPTNWLEIWTPEHGFDLFQHYRDHLDQIDKPGWRLDIVDKGSYSSVQCLVMLADVVSLYRQNRSFLYPGRLQCYYSKR